MVRKATVPKPGGVVEHDVAPSLQGQQVVEYYHATLKQSPEALDYLHRRGLRAGEAIDRFRLGFCFAYGLRR